MLELRDNGGLVHGLAVPWDSPGQGGTEEFAPGSLSWTRGLGLNLEHAPQQIIAFEDHGLRLWHADDGLRFESHLPTDAGVRAKVRQIAQAPHGGASVEFLPLSEERRGGVRRITRGLLTGLALTLRPSYREANVAEGPSLRAEGQRLIGRHAFGVDQTTNDGVDRTVQQRRARKSRLQPDGTARAFVYAGGGVRVIKANEAQFESLGADLFKSLRDDLAATGASTAAADIVLQSRQIPGALASGHSGSLVVREVVGDAQSLGLAWLANLADHPDKDRILALVNAGRLRAALDYRPIRWDTVREPASDGNADIRIVRQAVLTAISLIGFDGEAAKGSAIAVRSKRRGMPWWLW